MSSHFTREIQDEHIACFGPSLGPVYSALSADLVHLYSKWLEYRALFGESPGRVELVNSIAPSFFRMVQDILWNDVLLHVARLTDPPQRGAFENLTLLCLDSHLDDENLRTRIRDLNERALSRAAFARDYRNKRLAHNDLSHALERAEPLTLGSRQDVEEVLAAFSEVLNALNSHFAGATMAYREVIGDVGGAHSLLYALADARQTEDERRRRIESGDFRPEDLNRPSVP